MIFYLLRLAIGFALFGSILGHLFTGTELGSIIGSGICLIIFGFTYKKFLEG